MIKNLNGTQDYWQRDTKKWQKLEQSLFNMLKRWGYDEIRTPIIEPSTVFEKLGSDSDIIGKQMYYIQHPTESIVLRPEGTSSVVRSGIQHHKITRSCAKIWYYGPMFRHERPQKGRLRQFHQLGAEIFGYPGSSIEAEMLDMLCILWSDLTISDCMTLEINTIGSLETRARYKAALIDYLNPYFNSLDEDSQRRLTSNPLRILDSKVQQTQDILNNAPILTEYLTTDERQHFDILLNQLTLLGHKWTHNKRLVRGLDYYNDIVFEFTTTKLGAQGTVCAGGRYDMLASTWGKQVIPALGFSLGMERLLELLPDVDELSGSQTIIAFTQVAESMGLFLKLMNEIRALFPGTVLLDHAQSNFNNKYNRALKSKPLCIITLESEEWKNQQVSLRIPGKPSIRTSWNAQEILTQCQQAHV